MNAAAATQPRRIGLFGAIRITVRLMAIAALLLACQPLYYLFHALRLKNPWPRRFLGSLGWIAGVRLKVEGERPRPGAFLIANHVSWIDIPAIAAVTGTAFVGHDGLSSTPLLKHLCAMNDTVFIARHDRTSVHTQIADVRRALRDTGALTIFPEGTTSDGTGLLPFKSSLLSALEPVPQGVSVVPVLLDYGEEAADIAWIGTEHGVANFLRVLARRRNVGLTVRFLPALEGDQLRDRKTMSFAARETILAALH